MVVVARRKVSGKVVEEKSLVELAEGGLEFEFEFRCYSE